MKIVYHMNIKDLIGLCILGLLLIGLLVVGFYFWIVEKIDRWTKKKRS